MKERSPFLVTKQLHGPLQKSLSQLLVLNNDQYIVIKTFLGVIFFVLRL